MRAVSFPRFLRQLLGRCPPAVTAPRAEPAQAAPPPLGPVPTQPRSSAVPLPPAPIPVRPIRVGAHARALWRALHVEDDLAAAVRHGMLAAGTPRREAKTLVATMRARLDASSFAHEGGQVLVTVCSDYELRAMPAAVEQALTPLRTALPKALTRAAAIAQDANAPLSHPANREDVQRFARLGTLVDSFASPAGLGPLLPNTPLLLALADALDDEAIVRATRFFETPLGSAYAYRVIPALNAWCADFLRRVELFEPRAVCPSGRCAPR